MKQIVILSGKGGTGKTTVTAALAHLASASHRLVLVDADVDAANLALLLRPTLVTTTRFDGGEVAVIDEALCHGCAACRDACRFDAIVPSPTGRARVMPLLCEGCRRCVDVCRVGAIHMASEYGGERMMSDTRFGPLFHAELEPGAENSGKLVTEVRQAALVRARASAAEWILIDGPPGIGCPVIAATGGCDLGVVVAEATLPGEQDLHRALDTLAHFQVPALVCVNKADLDPPRTQALERSVRERGLEVAARLPFDEAVVQATRTGCPVTELADGPVAQAMGDLWQAIGLRLRTQESACPSRS